MISDCKAAIDALIYTVSVFQSDAQNPPINIYSDCLFELESIGSNSVARTISNSAIRDQRFNSYLALDGAAWLHNLTKKRTCDVFGFFILISRVKN